MLARNTDFIALAGTPAARAVDAAFSPSLLASTAVLSQPHPDRKSVLVEANALFMADLLGTGMSLQRTFRQGYSLDTRNSAITSVRATPDLVVLEVLNHFATGSISVPQGGAAPGSPAPSVPRTLPDARSLFMTMHYSLARMPAEPMRRAARTRASATSPAACRTNTPTTSRARPRQRFVNRWRLEKKDPVGAALSEPVKADRLLARPQHSRGLPRPRSPPACWSGTRRSSASASGTPSASEVQPENADFDTLDFGRASIRWMTNAAPTFGAIGPIHRDPRSGEILDADIGIESLSSRSIRRRRAPRCWP